MMHFIYRIIPSVSWEFTFLGQTNDDYMQLEFIYGHIKLIAKQWSSLNELNANGLRKAIPALTKVAFFCGPPMQNTAGAHHRDLLVVI